MRKTREERRKELMAKMVNGAAQKRWLFHYSLNEFIHAVVILWLLLGGAMRLRPHVSELWGVFTCYCTFYALHMLLVVSIMAYSCMMREGLHKKGSDEPRFNIPEFREFTFEARDGVRLKVYTSAEEGTTCFFFTAPDAHGVSGPKKPGGKCMLLANGLGVCGPFTFNPIYAFYGPEYTYIRYVPACPTLTTHVSTLPCTPAGTTVASSRQTCQSAPGA